MKNLSPEMLDEEGYGILFARVASNLIGEGKIEQATLLSEVGIKKYPNYAQGHFLMAKCYQEKDMSEEARTEYERVLKYDSSHLGALRELANISKSNGLIEVYKDYLFQMLTLDPLNSKLVDESREQGVYDLWKMDGKTPFSQIEKIKPDEIGDDKDSSAEVEESELSMPKISEEPDDSTKIDLSQFENQDDDFNTIMDGLIPDDAEGNEEVDINEFVNELDKSVEEESELLAEEKPVLDKEGETSSEAEFEFGEKGEPFLEMDFSQEQEKTEEVEVKPETETIDGDSLIEENVNDTDEDIGAADFDLDNLVSEESSEKSNTEAIKDLKKSDEEYFDADDNVLNLDDELESEKPQLQPETIIEDEDVIDTAEKQSLKLEIEPVPDESIDESPEVISPETEILPDAKMDKIENVEEDEAQAKEESPFVKKKIISQTLGEILVSQKKYKEARQVFEALKVEEPDNINIDKKIEILDKIIDLEGEDN